MYVFEKKSLPELRILGKCIQKVATTTGRGTANPSTFFYPSFPTMFSTPFSTVWAQVANFQFVKICGEIIKRHPVSKRESDKKNMRLGLKQEPHPAELIPVSVAWSDRCLSITGYFTHWCKNIHAPQKSNLSAGVVILLFHTFSVLKAENDQLTCLHLFLIFLDTSDSSINKIKFACFSFIIINYFLMVLESFMESVFHSFFSVKELFLQMISLLFQLTNLGKLFFVEQCTQSQLNHIPPTSSQPSIHPDPTAFLVN